MAIGIAPVKLTLRADVSYYIKKKQGFPSITDEGVMDIFLGGSGFSFKAALETADKSDKNHFFKVNNVTVDVKNMNIKLKKSKYKLLFSIVKPLLFRVMRPILQKVLSQQIKNSINDLDATCHEIHLEAKKAEAAIKDDPENAENVFQRYFNAAQKRMTSDKAKKAEEKTEDKKANIAMTQHDSLPQFKDIKLSSGISSKATEYKDLAKSGEKWESPVFAMGSAKESTNLPKVTEVVRKPHSVTASTLKDKSQTSYSHANGMTTKTTTTTTTTTSNGSTTLGSSNPVLSGTA